MTAEQKLFDELLSHALDLLRIAASQRGKVLRILAKLEDEVVEQLNSQELSKLKRRDLNRVLYNINVSIARYYDDIGLSIDVPNLAMFTANETSFAFEIALGVQSIKLPRQDYFNSLAKDLLIQGAPQADWWRGQSADTQFKFAAQVRMGLAASETNQQIIQRIVGKSGEPGIMETVKRNAASLVQTSVQAVANDARRSTFKHNPDLIKGLRQVSTLDSHTSLTCVAYSGAEWDLDYKPINGNKLPFKGGCPRHFNCRSLEVPITKTFRELGIDIDEPKGSTRASSDGQIDFDTTFDGYLKRKGKAYQDEVLGPGRADLWRAGKITLRDLVNGEGRPVTLDALIALAKKRRGS